MSVLYALPLFPTVASSPFRDLNAAAGCSSRALIAFAANRGNSGPPKQLGTGGPTPFPGWLVESSFSSGLNSVSVCHLYTSAAVSCIFERHLSFCHLGLSVSRTRLRLCPDSTGVVEVLSTT